jgi:PemK-like, MazF-like toxin of type II toxin-antitoxin system
MFTTRERSCLHVLERSHCRRHVLARPVYRRQFSECAAACKPCVIIERVNRFLDWIGLKQRLHHGMQSPHGFYFVVPTTTKPKVGSWYVPFRQADRRMIASLHQVRAIDHRRLSTKLGQLDDSDFERVREGFWKLYK